MQREPKSSSTLCFKRTLRKPFNNPKTTAAMLENATIWLATPTAALSEEPKKVTAISTKKRLAKTSILPVAKKAKANDGTNSFFVPLSADAGAFMLTVCTL